MRGEIDGPGRRFILSEWRKWKGEEKD